MPFSSHNGLYYKPMSLCNHANEYPRGGPANCDCDADCGCREPWIDNNGELRQMCPAPFAKHEWTQGFDYGPYNHCRQCDALYSQFSKVTYCAKPKSGYYRSYLTQAPPLRYIDVLTAPQIKPKPKEEPKRRSISLKGLS